MEEKDVSETVEDVTKSSKLFPCNFKSSLKFSMSNAGVSYKTFVCPLSYSLLLLQLDLFT